VLGVFLFGLFVARAPRACGVTGLLISPAAYGALMFLAPELAFLRRMAISFLGVMAVLGLMTLLRPLPAPVQMPAPGKIDLTHSRGAAMAGVVVIGVTIGLYVLFW
jgi:SSS family solute:Na+ symporter